eukprot:CAMPEP_0178923408 /NCGR_PEP_ID=MMETSP0786-20121207/16704_1 /TAXON_ID=186022 /ORGANISM="Thalassionema frauenfeldii, Strain CCMP 1798" /LENGTH=742 /DNA_ID=CAMNT_0020597903 /DNA_START=72 /DNA_END=2300 /DNA_ORIENTATION=+
MDRLDFLGQRKLNNEYNYYEYSVEDDDKSQSVDSGTTLFFTLLAIIFATVFCILPFVIWCYSKWSKKVNTYSGNGDTSHSLKDGKIHNEGKIGLTHSNSLDSFTRTQEPKPLEYDITLLSVMRFDETSKKILSYSIPFTFSALVNAFFHGIFLAVIGHCGGTEQMIAYAEIVILFDLMDELLKGPLHANPTVCTNAIGANNNVLAGQYIQLSIILYAIVGAPIFGLFFFFTDDLILWLGWGNEEVASSAQEFARIYMWNNLVSTIREGFGHLLDVTDHEMFTTVVNLSTVGLTAASIACVGFSNQLTLSMVGLIFFLWSLVGLVFMLLSALFLGWLEPFKKGLFHTFSMKNPRALANMLRVSIPLSLGSFLINIEWVALGIFAAHVGMVQAEAWSISAYIWHLFESLTYGIGDAAEIQVALHLGKSEPDFAELAAKKSLFLGLLCSAFTCSFFLAAMPYIPSIFTFDTDLGELIADTLPYMALGYPTLTFGYICWYIVGATTRYNYGTCNNLISIWVVTLPLGALFTFYYGFGPQALMASVVFGYTFFGCCLYFVVSMTDWNAHASKVNHKDFEEGADGGDRKGVRFSGFDRIKLIPIESHISLASLRSRRAKALAGKNTILFIVGPGPLGLSLASPSVNPKGTIVTAVSYSSPLFGRILPNDRIVSIDGFAVGNAPAPMIAKILEGSSDAKQRQITVIAPRKRFFQRNLLSCDKIVTDYDPTEENLKEIEMPTKLKYRCMV